MTTTKCGTCGRVVPVKPDLEIAAVSHVDPDGEPCFGIHLPAHYRDAVWLGLDLWTDFEAHP